MKAGFLQNNPQFLRVRENVARALSILKNKKADLWVLPELFASGYRFKSKSEVRRAAETIPSGETARALADFALANDCAVVAGLPEKSGKKYYNSAVLTFGGKTFVYRKTHLFAEEKRFFTPGDTGFKVWEYKGVSLGIMICFDWFFPEAARTLALKGAQIIAHPSNLVLPWGPEAMKIRSLENRIFSVTANRVGTERGLTFIGNSQIAGPRGEVFVRADRSEETAETRVLDAALALNKKVTPQNHLFKDRRKKMYELSSYSGV